MRQKFLLMLFALICQYTLASAQTFFVGDLKFFVVSEEEKTCELGVYGCPEDKINVVIPENVTYNGAIYKVVGIGSYGFGSSSKLESVVLPPSLTRIGVSAFNGCTNLKTVNLPEGVKSIGQTAFKECSKLTSINLPNSITYIGRQAFELCESLTSIAIPNTLTSIDQGTFSGCRRLTAIDLPNSITSIGSEAFKSCEELISIDLPKNLTNIDPFAFQDCSKLTSIELPSSINSIESYSFDGCSSLSSVTLPKGLISIGNYAFRGCTNLIFIDLPNTVTSIGEGAFEKCSALTSIDLSNTLTKIGSGAFRDCSMLRSITLPESVTSIGSSVFTRCSELVSVDLPSSLTSISDFMFTSCSALTSIVLPTSITSIGHSSFNGCTALREINLPPVLTSIGMYTFKNCTSLTSLDFPNTLSTIGDYAFQESGLKYVNLPNSITSIGNEAFNNCKSLETIAFNIDSNSIEFGNNIFSGPITTVIYNTETPRSYTTKSIFRIFPEDATLYVPQEIIEKIKDYSPWKEFKNVQPLPEMSLNSDSLEMWTGVDGELNVEVTPEEMPFGKVEIEWSSKESDIISLDVAGNSVRIAPLSAGDATIDCVLKWGDVWKLVLHCEVTVKETLKGLKIEAEKETILKGKSLILSTELEPLNSYYQDITWTSNDESIAQVLPSTNGRAVVKGLKAGTVTITAEAGSNEEGGYAQDSIEITVIQPVESIYLDPAVWEAVEGETLQLTVTILPEDATDKTLEWLSSDDEIATVDETGLVSVLKEGNCVITARTTDGSDLTAECHISITTGMEEILFDSTATVDVFTLEGVKIKSDCKRNSLDDLTSGIYLLRKGNKVEKLIIH